MASPDERFPVICDQSNLAPSERAAWPRTIPWELVEPWRAQAERNHDQTLEQLGERGGLSPSELWIAAHGLGCRALMHDPAAITESAAGAWLVALVAAGNGFDSTSRLVDLFHTQTVGSGSIIL